jgi:hypothetical protein
VPRQTLATLTRMTVLARLGERDLLDRVEP